MAAQGGWFLVSFFFVRATATAEIYTLSLHDALPICLRLMHEKLYITRFEDLIPPTLVTSRMRPRRSEEHTSELQSHSDLVCRLLLEKKNVADGTASAGRRLERVLTNDPCIGIPRHAD